MYIVTDLEEQIMREIDAVGRVNSLRGYDFGGISGSGGGSGSPIGGIIGQLAQKYVTFDTTEGVDPTIPFSGASLVNNLNRIRSGDALGNGIILLRHLSSGLIIPTESYITVEGTGGSPVYENINTIRFTNADLDLIGLNTVNVTIVSSGSGGSGISGSGYKSIEWFVDGSPSPIFLSEVHKLSENFTPVDLTTVCQTTGSGNLSVTLYKSLDAITWESVGIAGIYAGNRTDKFNITSAELLKDTYLGLQIDSCPELPSGIPFENLSFILHGIGQVITSSGSGSLPVFSPKRIPYADNTTGTLTESIRFNHLRDNGSDMTIIGSEDYTRIGGSLEKVGLVIVREEVDGGLVMETYSEGTYSPSLATLRARGTQTVPEALLQNDVIFRFTGRGYGQTAWAGSPRFRFEGRTTEDWTDAAQGTKAVIGVTKLGETATTDIVTVDGTGLLITGDINATGKLIGIDLQVSGNSPAIGDFLSATDTSGNFITTHRQYAWYDKISSQTISPSNTTIIDFEVLQEDLYSCVTTGISWKFTVPENGLYEIVASILLDDIDYAEGELLILELYKNGGLLLLFDHVTTRATTLSSQTLKGSCILRLNSSDYIDMRLLNGTYQDSTISANEAGCFIQITRIG
jgi:hypothetical protein